MKDTRTLDERMYDEIRDLVRNYGIIFNSTDGSMESFIDFYLENQATFNNRDTAQKRYNDVKNNISRGLIYILKIVEKVNQENSSWNINFLDYYVNSSERFPRLYLNFGKLRADLEPGTNWVTVHWYVAQNSNITSSITSFASTSVWLPSDISADRIIASVRTDFNFIKDHLYNL